MHATQPATTWDGLECVVTGGTGALGRAIVRRLLAAGARVHVPWWNEAEVASFPAQDRVALTRVDLADEAAVESFYGGIPNLFASIQAAGGFAMAPIVATSASAFEEIWRLNTLTAFVAAREAVRAMRRSEHAARIGGRIVFVLARPALRPVGGMVAYSSSKAAVASLAESMSEELINEGILVNAVVPSIMNTAANRTAMPDADHARWPTVEAVAEAIAFLASPSNTLTSGALLPVYGRA